MWIMPVAVAPMRKIAHIVRASGFAACVCVVCCLAEASCRNCFVMDLLACLYSDVDVFFESF